MDNKIIFKSHKIFNRKNRKFLYCIYDSALYEIDDKLEQILAMNGCTLNELLYQLSENKNIESDEAKQLLQMLYSAGLVEDFSKPIETDVEAKRGKAVGSGREDGNLRIYAFQMA